MTESDGEIRNSGKCWGCHADLVPVSTKSQTIDDLGNCTNCGNSLRDESWIRYLEAENAKLRGMVEEMRAACEEKDKVIISVQKFYGCICSKSNYCKEYAISTSSCRTADKALSSTGSAQAEKEKQS